MMQGSQSLTQMLEVQLIIDTLIHWSDDWFDLVMVHFNDLKLDIIIKNNT
jgi:hypothetical protein